MQNIQRVGLILATSVLLYLAWPPHTLGPLMFIAFVPILFFFDSIRELSIWKRFSFSFLGLTLALFLFGYGTSYNAWGEYDDNVHVAAIMSIWPEALITSLYVFVKKWRLALLYFILSWGAVEILQTHWEMNAPLFMIGNGLSKYPSLIQHYSIWGVLGGTMHIIAVNVLIYLIVKKTLKKEKRKKEIIGLTTLFLPVVLSVFFFLSSSESDSNYKVAIAMGHFDHFTKDYSDNPMLLVDKYNKLLETVDLQDVNLVILPESAIVNGGWTENLSNPNYVNPFDSICPGKELFLGSHMFSIYKGDNKEYYNVRYHKASDIHYVSHNCVVFRGANGSYTLRSKEKYIPFHEAVPYPSIFLFAKKWFNKEEVPTFITKYPRSHEKVFKTQDRVLVNPLMCFESTFTDMAVRHKDADFTLVLANESWNSESRGKKQYIDYLAAKAIESGKGILKVANGGYSGFIDSKGRMKEIIGFKNPIAKIVEIEADQSASIYMSISKLLNYLTVIITIGVFLFGLIQKKPTQDTL